MNQRIISVSILSSNFLLVASAMLLKNQPIYLNLQFSWTCRSTLFVSIFNIQDVNIIHSWNSSSQKQCKTLKLRYFRNSQIIVK